MFLVIASEQASLKLVVRKSGFLKHTFMSGCLDGDGKSSVSPHPDSRIASGGKDGDGQWIPQRMECAKQFGSRIGAQKGVTLS